MDAERKCITSCMARAASVVASSTLRAGPRISQGGDRRSVSRRTGAEIKLAPSSATSSCSRAGLRREPFLGAAQDCRSFGGAAGEEEHAAELDCRRGDRAMPPRSTISTAGDRLRRAGACVRLAELEQDRGAVASAGGSSRARESSAAAPCVAQGERVAGGVPQRHRPGVAGRLGVHDLRRDLAGGRSALAQDRRRRVVQSLPFGGRQVAVDRRAQDRVGEAGGAAGSTTPADQRRLQSPVGAPSPASRGVAPARRRRAR